MKSITLPECCWCCGSSEDAEEYWVDIGPDVRLSFLCVECLDTWCLQVFSAHSLVVVIDHTAHRIEVKNLDETLRDGWTWYDLVTVILEEADYVNQAYRLRKDASPEALETWLSRWLDEQPETEWKEEA